VIYDTHDGFAYVVTNHHVIADAPQVHVTVNDSLSYAADVLGFNQFLDLAAVRIPCGRCEKAPFGPPGDLKTGMEVVIVGYPSGSVSGQASVTRGIVSAIGPHPYYPADTIQTDAAINPGNSGGPMFSLSGDVIGITTFKWITHSDGTGAEGLGFAIPATTAYAQLLELEQGVFVGELTFEVRAGQEMSLPWDMRTGARLEFAFEANLDIDVRFHDPDGLELARWDRTFSGRAAIGARKNGTYTLVFDNSFSWLTTKVVNLFYEFESLVGAIR
jgi:hypothetical protein